MDPTDTKDLARRMAADLKAMGLPAYSLLIEQLVTQIEAQETALETANSYLDLAMASLSLILGNPPEPRN